MSLILRFIVPLTSHIFKWEKRVVTCEIFFTVYIYSGYLFLAVMVMVVAAQNNMNSNME